MYPRRPFRGYPVVPPIPPLVYGQQGPSSATLDQVHPSSHMRYPNNSWYSSPTSSLPAPHWNLALQNGQMASHPSFAQYPNYSHPPVIPPFIPPTLPDPNLSCVQQQAPNEAEKSASGKADTPQPAHVGATNSASQMPVLNHTTKPQALPDLTQPLKSGPDSSNSQVVSSSGLNTKSTMDLGGTKSVTLTIQSQADGTLKVTVAS